jgi:MoxR-like ATPase
LSLELISEAKKEFGRILIGKEEDFDLLMTSLITQGHILIEGPPGIGKTTAAKTFAKIIGGRFIRIQMTPDLLPADVIGSYVYNQKKGDFELRKGPIFANILMLDELNRATPRLQAALLEAMQERQVSIEGTTLQLPNPFLVIATQLPYGALGTYPLSEVQIDRFAFRLEGSNPPKEVERRILERIDEIESYSPNSVIEERHIEELEELARKVHVSDGLMEYILNIIDYLRKDERVKAGPSPRGGIWLMKACRAWALLDGRDFVIPDDVKALAHYVLDHRLTISPELDEVSPNDLVEEALRKVSVPK